MRLPEAITLRQSLREQVLTISAQRPTFPSFESLALAVFQYQATFNPLYRTYLHYLGVQANQVTTLRQIPFMPIGFFRNHVIQTGRQPNWQPDPDTLTFASSGTTGERTSRHFVSDPALYDAICTDIFEQMYGPLSNFHILALLPSYLERNNSSLVYMVRQFIAQTGSDKSGFYLHNHHELTEQLRKLTQQPDEKKILLIGVTFGLLDWAESTADLSFLSTNENLIVMETGGMKGRRQELLREEVHQLLRNHLGVSSVHSEYGMTELLSQAYSAGDGIFRPSSTLRIVLRDINDPFSLYPADYTRTGGINVIDLANLDSCSFIETQDLGQYVGDKGDFRVIGRFDNSDVRGCNLLVL
ncbi:acyltransferase [Spirosoma terrae]|uniref:Acyl transferase n=1 Tax=Spirosoma terrae TaxID=1968276 RepID=A0A6L9L3L2_9BACT|nr:acyl transferase [Spirosoma terrae]NDU94042.1 acyl transferase [Spirosoma terrae]